MSPLLSDADVTRLLRAEDAVQWIREAVVAAHAGRLHTPPRISADLGDGKLIFTTGALTGEWFGYRSYDSFDADPGSQLVVVHDWRTGAVRGVAVGNELGRRRVGAIGAVAVDALTDPAASSLGLVGTGAQAWNQLWALRAVRELTTVSVYSRDAERRKAFAARVSDELELPARAVGSAREAVEDKELVILATSSSRPVVDAAWIRPGGYVTTLGPKQFGRAEFGPDLVARADLAVTDSIAQTKAYDPPFILTGTPQHERLVSLGAVLAGEVERPVAGQTVIFCSVGLAGTEAYLLNRLIDR